MDIINFWVAWEQTYPGPSVASLLPSFYGPSTSMIQTNSVEEPLFPEEAVQAELFTGDPMWTLRSYYQIIDDLGEIVPLREELQWLESEYPEQFVVGGMWHVDTGEPVGGVGSPWFVTPPEIASFLPNGVIEDVTLLAGQVKRKFV